MNNVFPAKDSSYSGLWLDSWRKKLGKPDSFGKKRIYYFQIFCKIFRRHKNISEVPQNLPSLFSPFAQRLSGSFYRLIERHWILSRISRKLNLSYTQMYIFTRVRNGSATFDLDPLHTPFSQPRSPSNSYFYTRIFTFYFSRPLSGSFFFVHLSNVFCIRFIFSFHIFICFILRAGDTKKAGGDKEENWASERKGGHGYTNVQCEPKARMSAGYQL